MKSLYAYFGLMDQHTIDSPGHSLYQLGLLDSIKETYGDNSFDFYSYYPKHLIEANALGIKRYPTDKLGNIFNEYSNNLFGNGSSLIMSLLFDNVIENIKRKEYSKLYLKARFRNLSTLRKKWLDALEFETIIETAIAVGYSPDQINILDTDLSLSERFIEKYSNRITILIPSIDFPGISSNFLNSCTTIHQKNPYEKDGSVVFYGNIDTSKYKSGNSKSSMLNSVLSEMVNFYDSDKIKIICKNEDYINSELLNNSSAWIARNDRFSIWDTLCSSNIMINVSKEKYDERGFIPARIYEAMIFGMIPVSYNFKFLSETFSFSNIVELREIFYYLDECTESDYRIAYNTFIKEYLKHANY